MTANFIPNGRTSRVKRGEASLQVQTEYAYRPYPRLTTTVLTDGRVLHKIEKKLERPIESAEEQSDIERMIKRQHADVMAIIEENVGSKTNVVKVLKNSHSDFLTIADRLQGIPGVRTVYDVDNDGSFLDPAQGNEFKKIYPVIFKGLKKLIGIFPALPGISMTREKGVLELERDYLYLVSCGDEICIVDIGRPAKDVSYEHAIKKVVSAFFAAG